MNEYIIGTGKSDTIDSVSERIQPVEFDCEPSQLDEELAKVDAIEVPDISTSFALLRINSGRMGWEKKDKEASEKAAADNGADPEAVTLSKKLLKGVAEVKAIQKHVTKARGWLAKNSVAWDDAYRMVPAMDYLEVYGKLTEFQQTMMGTNGDGTDNGLVYDLCEVYEFKRVEAQATLGRLFDPKLYPDVEEVRSKYYFRIGESVPSPDEPRIALGREATDMIRERMKEQFVLKFDYITTDIYKRLKPLLENMVERLDEDYEGTYHGTLVTNVTHMTKLMRDYNMTNDKRMTDFANKLDQALHGVTAESLKISESKSIEVRNTARDVLNSLPSLDL